MSNIAAVFVQKFLNPIEIGPQSGFFRVNGGLNVKLWARDLPMHGIASFDLEVTIKVWGIMLSVLKKKKKGCSGKDLQKKKVLSLE